MHANTISPFLRRVFLADATATIVVGLLLFLGAEYLATLLQLPDALLRPLGLVLIPCGVVIAYIGTRVSSPRWAMWAIIIVNVLWVVESVVLLVSGTLTPNAAGYAFVIGLAVIVAILAELETIGLRQRVNAMAAVG